MIQLPEIAHYGRWFPFYERDYDLWWFDKSTCKVISAEELSEICGCTVHTVQDAVAVQENSDFVPLFRVDIPALELEYAKSFLPEAEVKRLEAMSAKNTDREFQTVIEQNDLIQHWHNYELGRLIAAAKQWCERNHISCKL